MIMITPSNRVFDPGTVVLTRGVSDATAVHAEFEDFVRAAYTRFVTGDWGDTGDDSWEQNDACVKNPAEGMDLLAVYKLPEALANKTGLESKIWIKTDSGAPQPGVPSGRITTVLWPSEY